MTLNILVTGASIAGNGLALWLQRLGHKITVVERAPTFRDGGQNVDVRGVGRDIVSHLGLLDEVMRLNTGERGMAFVDENDRVRASFGRDDFGGNGPTAELEIMRGDLAKLLYERAKGGATYRFDDAIEAVHDDGAGVDVTFKSGALERYDLLLVAEGIGSSTRRLLFGDAVRRLPFNLYTCYFTMPKGPTDTDMARWYTSTGGRSVFLRPDRFGNTRAGLSKLHAPDGHEKLDVSAQKMAWQAWFADAGWETPRVLQGMHAADDFYMEAVGQVHMDTWARGRVALVGDSAWCASPLSGMGTTLALVGPYILAGELSQHADHRAAFEAFEKGMRPLVERAQRVSPKRARQAHPVSRFELACYNGVMALVSKPWMRSLFGKAFLPPAENFALPSYGHHDLSAPLAP